MTRNRMKVDDMQAVLCEMETEDLVAQVLCTKSGCVLA